MACLIDLLGYSAITMTVQFMAGAEKETATRESMVDIVRALPVLELPEQFLAVLEGGPPCLPANKSNVNMAPHTALGTCSSAASRTRMFDRPHAQLSPLLAWAFCRGAILPYVMRSMMKCGSFITPTLGYRFLNNQPETLWMPCGHYTIWAIVHRSGRKRLHVCLSRGAGTR
jgi:hypothetical protein